MKPDPNIRLVAVYHSADPGLMGVATSLLDDAGIDYTVSGEGLRNVMGWGPLGPLAVGVPEIYVREEDAEQVAAILADLDS